MNHNNTMNLDINSMVIQVKNKYPEKDINDIKIDLQFTNDIQTTLNRIESGQFLKDTIRDTSKAFIILDSDEEEEEDKAKENRSIELLDLDLSMESEIKEKEEREIALTEKNRSPSPYIILSSPSIPSQKRNEDRDNNDILFSRIPTFEADLFNEISSYTETYSSSQVQDNIETFSPKSSSFINRSRNNDILTDDEENDINIKSDNHPNIDNHGSDSDDSLLSMGDLISQINTQDEKERKKQLKGKQKQYQPVSLIDNDNDDDDDDDDDLLSLDQLKDWESDSSITNTPKQFNKNKKQIDKEKKAIQKRIEKQAKEQDRLEAKRLKELEKEQKRLEKEKQKRVQQVNRLKVDRFEVIKEMIVVVHDPIFCSNTHGQLLLEALKENDVQYKSIPSTNNKNKVTLKWERKTNAAWDKSKQQFVPFENNEVRILNERAAFLFLQVEDFIEIIQENDLDIWIDNIKFSTLSDDDDNNNNNNDHVQLFLMIEGLEAFYKKKINWQRRKFSNRVLENMNDLTSENNNTDTDLGDSEQSSSTTSRKRKRNNHPIHSLLENSPSRTELEEILTYLQVMKDVKLIISIDEEDSVDWIISLTADLARSIYNNITSADLYKSQAPAKTGIESKDIWSKMLQEIQLCTPAVANSIIEEYPTLMSLHKRYNQLNQVDGEYLLANLEVERSFISNKDRTINKSMSKKIHTIFTSDDPTNFIA